MNDYLELNQIEKLVQSRFSALLSLFGCLVLLQRTCVKLKSRTAKKKVKIDANKATSAASRESEEIGTIVQREVNQGAVASNRSVSSRTQQQTQRKQGQQRHEQQQTKRS